ncbi:MAG: uracil-DNA glycosylase [Limnochordaceae bacterium]|nr:uracil-DNA glycosylase [Limnochordaceae bacterium]
MSHVSNRRALFGLHAQIITCRACPRLVAWREAAAAAAPRRFQGQPYWARPLPGFGDPDARIVIVGLAPAAHGGNRTGRMFTGDQSGDFLFAALHRAGLANQPSSETRNDGLTLTNVYITAAVRCAPPANRPTTAEREACFPWLATELDLLAGKRVLLALGRIAFDTCRRYLRERNAAPSLTPAHGWRFAHGAAYSTTLTDDPTNPLPLWLVASYHPSQQNTFTGRLTPAMFDAVLQTAKNLASKRALPGPA